ncbi:MAG: nucleotidyltransferase domain-containing protein [Magnetococcus sp. DMHC-8]
MTPVTQEMLDAAVRAIVDAVQPERIVLFGSRARGEEQTDSDVDLLVIESEAFGPFRSRFREVASLERAMGSLPMATDILVYSVEEVERLKTSANHIVTRAMREGKVLHARS